MDVTELEALRAYARMLNTLSCDEFELILADDFVYESQMVFAAIESKQAFLKYIRGKLESIRHANSPVFAELGTVVAYSGKPEPCVVLAQGSKEELIGVVIARVEGGKLSRLDLCCVAPPPEAAVRSGDYPT